MIARVMCLALLVVACRDSDQQQAQDKAVELRDRAKEEAAKARGKAAELATKVREKAAQLGDKLKPLEDDLEIVKTKVHDAAQKLADADSDDARAAARAVLDKLKEEMSDLEQRIDAARKSE